MARIWAADGRDLVLCARRRPALEQLRDDLLTAHPDRTILVRELDVTDHVAVDRVFTGAAAELGGLDRVVANAGVMSRGSVGAGNAANNRATVATNFFGVLHQAEAALTLFRASGAGHLVLMSSVAGLRGMGGRMNVYSATKAAVATLAEGISSDLWHSPIRCRRSCRATSTPTSSPTMTRRNGWWTWRPGPGPWSTPSSANRPVPTYPAAPGP